MNMEH